jgi:hypothetical protein
LAFAGLLGIISQKADLFVAIAVRTSNPAKENKKKKQMSKPETKQTFIRLLPTERFALTKVYYYVEC